MFDSIGWGEILVIAFAGLFILGPERLPGAAAWLGRTVRQVKGYATSAQDQVRAELGPEFDDLRKPLQELGRMRGRDPRRALFDALTREDSNPARPEPAPRQTEPPTQAPQADMSGTHDRTAAGLPSKAD